MRRSRFQLSERQIQLVLKMLTETTSQENRYLSQSNWSCHRVFRNRDSASTFVHGFTMPTQLIEKAIYLA